MKSRTRNCLILFSTAVITLTLCAWLTGCNSCRKTEKTQSGQDTEKKDVEEETRMETTKPDKKIHTAAPPILPEAEVTSAEGSYKVVRAKNKTPFPIPKDNVKKMYIGDRIAAEDNARVVVEFTQGGKAALEGRAEMMIGKHLPAEIVILYGKVVVETSQLKGRTRRFKIQTPGGTLFHSGPVSEIVVAKDGSTRIYIRDCPSPDKTDKKGRSSKAPHPAHYGCSFIAGKEEQPLWSGDLVVIDAKLGESIQQGYSDTKEKAYMWLSASDEAFLKKQENIIGWFIKWMPEGIDKIDDMLMGMEKFRLANKDAIQELKSLRQESKTLATGDKAGKAMDNISAKMDKIKLELADNSKQMARLREVMLTKWYQLALRWNMLSDLMTDEILAKTGKDKSVMEAFFTSYEEKLLKIVRRRPRRKMPSKFPIPSIQKMPFNPAMTKLKPVAPSR